MYVFGGRGVDGKDLGDLAAFKISSMLHFFHVLILFVPLISVQTNGGTCSKIWVQHQAEDLVMQCLHQARVSSSWVGNRSD